SIYYIASRSSIQEVENMSINEPSQDEDLENELDKSHQDVAVEGDHFGQWFVDSIIENEENIKNNDPSFNWIQLFHDTNEQESNTNEGFVDELLFYGRVWGLARTATNKRNSDLDDDSNKENELINVQLRNPQKVITRGRPKS
ncbi:19431_t:CDS:2, partial [Cetraspora pellucida]